jgi:hypothetical protein
MTTPAQQRDGADTARAGDIVTARGAARLIADVRLGGPESRHGMTQTSVVNVRASQLAVAACGVHAVLFLALHLLEPQLSPMSSIISDYAAAGRAMETTAAFVAFAAVWAALAVGLGAAPASRTMATGRALLTAAAVAILVAAFLPESADPRSAGALARVQNLLARPGLFVAVCLVSLGLRAAPEWRAHGDVLLGLAAGALGGLILTVVVLLPAGYGGVGQRLLFLALYAWVWLASRSLRRQTARAA